MARAAIEVDGLREFRADLRSLSSGTRWTRELGQEHRALAGVVAGWSQQTARGMGPVQRHFAPAIGGKGGATGARISIDKAQRRQQWAGAQGAFWGSKAYPQFPPWVDTSWVVGGPSGGPYAINRTIYERSDEIVDRYQELVHKVSTSASSYLTETF